MSKKKILKKNSVAADLKKLSFSDLHAMYGFVNGLNNANFGKKVEAKALLRAKLADVENELYTRVFGLNPFALEKVEVTEIPKGMTDVKGVDPVKVISSFNSGVEGKTFVVAKNDERK